MRRPVRNLLLVTGLMAVWCVFFSAFPGTAAERQQDNLVPVVVEYDRPSSSEAEATPRRSRRREQPEVAVPTYERKERGEDVTPERMRSSEPVAIQTPDYGRSEQTVQPGAPTRSRREDPVVVVPQYGPASAEEVTEVASPARQVDAEVQTIGTEEMSVSQHGDESERERRGWFRRLEVAQAEENVREKAVVTTEDEQVARRGWFARRETVEPEESLEPREPIQSGVVVVQGDHELLEGTDLLDELKRDVAGILSRASLGQPERDEAIRDAVEKTNRALIDQGYFLAGLWVVEDETRSDQVTVFVDAGRVVESTFYNLPTEDDPERHPFSQRFFSERQLRRKLPSMEAGKIFNYNDFYSDIFSINAHPDVMVDADLRVRKEVVDGNLRRYVEADYLTEESFPLHGVLSLNNHGTETIGEWQAGVLLQYLNLTRRDDVLTVNLPFSLNQSLRSISSSYYLPYHWGYGGAWTLFGGYSEMEVDDILPGDGARFDEEGDGWFAGMQMSHRLFPSSKKHSLEMALGVTYRRISSTTYFERFALPERPISLLPVSLSFNYASLQPDRFGGRNFLSAETIFHHGSFPGVSDKDEFEAQRDKASPDYLIERIRAARIQPIFGSYSVDGEKENRWVLFMKGDAQIADGTLVPAEQMGLGGHATVRGYQEREMRGDHAFASSIELRTPLLLGSMSAPFLSEEKKVARILDPIDYLQLVAFADFGHVRYIDPLPTEDSSASIYSVGAGLRLSVTKNSQIRLDYGFPLKSTQESSGSGRFHLDIQFQF